MTSQKLIIAKWGLAIVTLALLLCAIFEKRLNTTVDRLTNVLQHNASPQIKYLQHPGTLEKLSSTSFIILVLCISIYVIIVGDQALWIIREDGILEWLTSLFYLTSAALVVRTGMKTRGRCLVSANLFLLSLLFFIVGMEEISWGQRIFDFRVPEILNRINVQDELTLHNIFSISLFTYPALAIVTSLLFLFPVMRCYSPRWGGLLQAARVPVAPLSIACLFCLAVISYIVVGIRWGTPTPLPISWYGVMPSADDEVLEFYFSCIFLICALAGWRLDLQAVRHQEI